MPVPHSARHPQSVALLQTRSFAALLCSVFLLLSPIATLAKPPLPQLRIPLDDLGFEQPSQHVISTGASIVNVNLVDDTHLLVSFAVRRLMKRLPEDPVTDQDRTILALLLELPSGKVLARTEWRVHDPSQYLWNLGNGTLLLRIRNTINTIAPVAHLASPDPFEQHPFLHSSRPIQALLLSPESDFLTLETSDPLPPQTYASTVAGHPMAAFNAATGTVTVADPAANPNPIQINFYRLGPAPDTGAIQARFAGVVRAHSPVYLPADAAGYLDVLDEGNNTWAFDFDTYTGKTRQMNLFDASCAPVPSMISRGEFVALACLGGNQRQTIAAFNLRGEEMWQQKLSSSYMSPRFLPAPRGGRFAFSRITLPSSETSLDDLSIGIANSQIVTVFQNNTGKELLRLDCSPIQQTAENVSLSPDGMSLALVRYGAIEIYRLPPLTPQDKSAIQLAEASAPEPSEVSVRIPQHNHIDTSSPEPAATRQTSGFASIPQASPAPAQGSDSNPPVPTTTATQGDEAPSRPPTLYTLPTDKPDGSPQDNAPSDTSRDAPQDQSPTPPN